MCGSHNRQFCHIKRLTTLVYQSSAQSLPIAWRRSIGRSPYFATLAFIGKQVVFHSKYGCTSPGGDTNLGVDMLGMMADGFFGDEEALSDLPLRVPTREQAKHLNFTLAQSCQ